MLIYCVDYVIIKKERGGHLKSKKLMLISTLVLAVPFGISFAMCLYNINYVEYCSLFGDVVEEMIYNYTLLGYEFDSSTREMYQDFANRGNLAFTALCFAVVVLIAYFVCFLISLKLKSIEVVQEQTEVLKNNTQQLEKIYCSNCNSYIEKDSAFCSKCGNVLKTADISKEKKPENIMKKLLIAFVVLQVVSFLIGLIEGALGGIFLMVALVLAFVIPVISVITVVKSRKLQVKNGVVLGIVVLCVYSFIDFIILLSLVIANSTI